MMLPLLIFAIAGAYELGAEAPASTIRAEHAASHTLDTGPIAAARESAIAAPELVLLQTNPWNMVIGSDSPAFALYADNTVIFRHGNGYKSVQLEKDERDELVRTLNLTSLSSLKGHYEAAIRTDQTKSYLFVFSGSQPFYLSTYGQLRQPEIRSRLPEEIVAAFDRLLSFDHSSAKEWLPPSIEVMIWPYEYAPGASITWPSDWPGLDSPTTVRRGDEDFSLFLTSDQLERLTTFLATRHPKGAVEIGGKKWAVSTRYPFPHERLWMAPKSQ